MKFRCPACRFTTTIQESRFPFRCKCGNRYESAADMSSGKAFLPPPVHPPLAPAEVTRRLSICQGCEYWNPEKQGCKVCGTCGNGQRMFDGLRLDPGKRCPAPGGSKWGPGASPLKVAFLTPGINCGGAERWMASLCQHFDPAKIHAQYVVNGESKHSAAAGWFPKWTRIVDVALLPEVLKRVDLLISWGPVSLDKRTEGCTIPIIDVAHGTLGHWDGMDHNGFKVQEAIARQAIAAGAHLAAVSEECLDNYPPEYRDKVTVIPNGAEVDRVQSSLTKEEARAKYGIPPECQHVVLFVGRFAKEKNLQALVDAMEFLPGWTLLAAGPQYKMPVRTEGKMIVMPGSVDPPGDLYRAADVLCMPSLHEAHSLTLIEGNLAGVPVVSYDYPAMRHLTAKHGPLARLVPVRCSPQELATAIFTAHAVFTMRPDDVQAIQRIAEENYTASAMSKRWEEYITNLGYSRPYLDSSQEAESHRPFHQSTSILQ
jgi:glycosyltransferase involved in cell wall biosynthesis